MDLANTRAQVFHHPKYNLNYFKRKESKLRYKNSFFKIVTLFTPVEKYNIHMHVLLRGKWCTQSVHDPVCIQILLWKISD